MPVALSEWRVRIGTFVHWIREYEVQERRERLLKERIRRLKVLCERLEAKRGDSGEESEDDKSRQDGPDSKGCPHKTVNIQSSGNSSDIKDLLTSCDQCIQDLLTASDSHIKEILTPSETCIKHLLTSNYSHIRELIIHSDSCFRELHMSADAGKDDMLSDSDVKELLTPRDSAIIEILQPKDYCTCESLTLRDSTIQDLLTPRDSNIRELLSVNSHVQEMLTPRDSCKSESLTAGDSYTNVLLTIQDSYTQELLIPRDSYTCESLSPRDSCIQESSVNSHTDLSLSAGDGHIQEMITPRDSYTSESLTTGDSDIHELFTPRDSYIQELLTQRDSYTYESLTPGDSYTKKLVPPGHSYTNKSLRPMDSYIQKLFAPRDSSIRALLTRTDSYPSGILTPIDSNTKITLTPEDSYVQEVLTSRDSYTIEPLTQRDSYIQELLKPSDSYINESLTPGHSFTNTSPTPGESYIQELLAPRDSYTIKLLMPTDSYANESLAPEDSYIQELIIPQDYYTDELLTPGHFCINTSLTPGDSYIHELLAPRDFYTNESLTPGHFCINTSLTPGDSYIHKLLAPRDFYTNESLTPGHSSTNTSLTPGDSYIQELLAPRDSYTTESLTPGDSYTQDFLTPRDFYTNESLTPGHSSTNTLLTPVDSYIQELLAPRDCYTNNILMPTDSYANQPLTPEDSYTQDFLTPTCRCSDIRELLTPRDLSTNESLTQGDSYIQELLTPRDSYTNESLTPGHSFTNTSLTPGDSYIHKLLAQRDSYTNEALTPGDSYTQDLLTSRYSDIRELLTTGDSSTNESLTRGDSYIQDFLTTRESYIQELLTPGDLNTNESLTPGDSYIQELLTPIKSYTNEPLTGNSYTNKLFTGVELESPRQGDNKTSPTSSLDSDAVQHGPFGGKEMANTSSRSSCHKTDSSKGTVDVMLSQQPYLTELLLVKAGDVELNPGPLHGSIDSALQESELVLLAEEVPVNCYNKLCIGLGISLSQSQHVLTQHYFNFPGALIHFFCRWKVRQRDGTNCRSLLGEILQNADMGALQTKLLKGEYLTSGSPTSSKDSVLQDSELILLAEVVPGDCYYKLCSGLGFSSSQSHNVLTQHHLNLPGALIELFCRWKGKQRDGANCRALLGEILHNADMGALQTKLLKGEYLTSGTPTSLIDNALQESELILLAEEVPVDCYYKLCSGLGFSSFQSRNVLTQHHFSFPHALIEFFSSWKVRQRDGTNCRALLGEILQNADMGALQTKLLKGEYLTSGTPTSLIYSVLQESELKLLAEEVPVDCYYKLCSGLGFSLSQSQSILTQHHFNFPGALIQMFCRWKVRQRDGTNCRALLGEILQNADMVALQTKLLKGEFLTSGTSSFDPILDTSQPFMTEAQVLQCGEDLKIFYRKQMCKIKPDPLDFNIIFDFERIYTNLTLLRKEMGIMRTERPLDYTDLLTTKINGVLPKRLLVEGEGGVGKTTFCSKIAWDWVNGSPEFQRFSWVLVIPLCNIVKGQTIGDIMKNYLSDNNAVNPKQIDSYILSQPTKVLIVLDGLDKYDGDLSAEENSDISQILRFDKFKQCIVLVTTRPRGADKIKSNERLLRSYAFIVIKGFSTENVSTYISKYFVDDEKAGSELIRFIEVNDVIKENMAPFPIYLAMLCILWKKCDSEKRETIRRLKTFSQLFEQMIMFLRDHDISKVFDLDKEMENTKLCLQRIGSIAFSGILEKKLVFSEEDFSSCKEAMETCCRMGVLSRENQNVSRLQRTFNPSPRIITGVFFPHKLFQEYVASVYLASLYDTNREEYSRSMGKVLSKDPQEFRYLLYFTAALGKEVGLDIVEKIQQNDFANVQQRKRNNDFLADVAFEAYNKDVAKVVGQQIFADGRILTIDKDMPAHTFSGYLFIMEQHGMETLVFRDRLCGPTVSRDLANILFESKSLSRLVFYHTTLDDDFYQLMHKRVPTKTEGKSSIKELVVDLQFLNGLQRSNNCDINVTVEDLFPSLKHLTFTTLHTVTPGVVERLAHSSLEVLFIEHDEEGSELVPLIGEPASLGRLFSTSFPQLTCLTFRELVMGNIRSEAILRNLKNHLHLKSISIISCFTDDELDPLAEQITTENRMKLTLQHDRAQRSLSFGSSIGPLTTDMIDALCHRTCARQLVGFNYGVKIAGEECFPDLHGREVDSKIQTFKVYNLNVRDDQSASCCLGKFLSLLTHLTDLEICSCSFHDDFYTEIADQPSSIQTFKVHDLNLRDDKSASYCLGKFVSLLPHLSDLKIYSCSLHDDFYKEIADRASSSQIQTFKVYDLNLRNDQSASNCLGKFLSLLPHLTDLQIRSCSLYDDFYKEIAVRASSSRRLLIEEALMAHKDSPEEESEKPVESVDDDETVNGFGFTEELRAYLLDVKVLTINVNAPDLTAIPKEQELKYHPEPGEEPQYNPPITSWAWNADQDRIILDLQQSILPLTEVLSFVAQSCPKLRILRLHANVLVSISEESVLESDSATSVDESDEDDSSKFELYMRCRQTTNVPLRALLASVSSIFPKISDLTLDGDDQTKLDILGYMPPLPSSFLPKLCRLCLQQFVGPLCLLTFFKFVVEKLSHLPFLRISQCNVNVQMESEMEFSESALSHLEIIPANVIPFACLNELVFKAFKSITNFMVQNIAAEHQIYLLLNWTKTGQMPTERLYLKQSTPLKAFKDLLTIVKKFPRISKLETDECGSLEKTELLEIVRSCTQLQYFSSVASGVSRILAISDQFMRKPTSKPISKSFGKLGGELRLETHDITLCVPEGAIQEEGEIEIVLQALTNPPSSHFQEGEMVCSFGFQCTILNSPRFRFAVPVRVTLPHSAILHDPSKVRTGIYHGELWHDTGDVEISTVTYIPSSENRLPRCEVDEKEITVIIDHFSYEWPFLKIWNFLGGDKSVGDKLVEGKRLGCLPYVPNTMPPGKKPKLRVHLFDNVKGNQEAIEEEEFKCKFHMAHTKIELQARDDLVVTYGMDGSNNQDNTPKQISRTILFSDIKQLLRNTVKFRMDFVKRVEQFASVNLFLTEGSRDKGDLSFDLDYTGAASGSSQGAMAVGGSASGVTDEFDEILQSVAEYMSKDQEICRLASKLGVKVANYNRFIEENRLYGVTWTGTLNMLRTWRNGIDRLQERAILRNALLCCKQVRLVSTLLPEEGD